MAGVGACGFCGEPAVHAHHVTGKHPTKQHLDPPLVIDVCGQHHVLVHEDLRSQGLDRPREPEGWGDGPALAFRLQRLATFLARYATYHDEPFFGLLAAALWTWTETAQEEPRND
jgi:hypothetical protein